MMKSIRSGRERETYPTLFGRLVGRYSLDSAIFTNAFGRKPPRPVGKQACLLFEQDGVRTWVTSGLSDDLTPSDHLVAGIGMEFLLRIESAAEWPLEVLSSLMALQLMIATGAFGDEEGLVWEHSRVPLPEPIPGSGGRLTGVFVGPWSEESVVINGRHFALFVIFPVSEREMTFANNRGGDVLLNRLVDRTSYPIVDVGRSEVV